MLVKRALQLAILSKQLLEGHQEAFWCPSSNCFPIRASPHQHGQVRGSQRVSIETPWLQRTCPCLHVSGRLPPQPEWQCMCVFNHPGYRIETKTRSFSIAQPIAAYTTHIPAHCACQTCIAASHIEQTVAGRTPGSVLVSFQQLFPNPCFSPSTWAGSSQSKSSTWNTLTSTNLPMPSCFRPTTSIARVTMHVRLQPSRLRNWN